MQNLIQQNSSCEIIVKPLIEAANTKNWQNALDILYISGHTLSFSKELINFPCLISATGPVSDLERSIDLLSVKGDLAIKPLISSGLKMFLPTLLLIARNPQNSDDPAQVSMIMSHVIPKFEEHQKELLHLMVQGALIIPDLIAPAFFTSLLENRKKHIHCCQDEERYEKMVFSLKKLGIIESLIQISICPECANYQVILSKNPIESALCPKCGSKWATVTFYSFLSGFGKFKFESSDISLFISSYLKFRINNEVFLDSIDIYPNVVYTSESGKNVELDVHIPEFKVGIECKIYEDPFAPMTNSRLHSITTKLIPQIERYKEMNIEKLAIVTNLPSSTCNEIIESLEKKLKLKQIDLKLKILPGESEDLLSFLDEIVRLIVKSKTPKIGSS